MHLVLASQSPYRKALLENLGVKFSVQQPLVDETKLKISGPRDLTELSVFLATEKAASLRSNFPESFILGADQLAEKNGQRFDKPGSRVQAQAQLMQLQGESHRLITSCALVVPGNSTTVQTFTDVTTVYLRAMSEAEINAYLSLDEPYDCAASYKIERAGIGLIERLETKDPSAIQGIPLIALVTTFRRLGFSLAQLWSHI